MSAFTTIPLRPDTKSHLESLMGHESYDNFVQKLIQVYERENAGPRARFELQPQDPVKDSLQRPLSESSARKTHRTLLVEAQP